MAEFRYQGITLNGKPLQGTLLAPNRFEAKRKVAELVTEHRVRIRALHKRVPFAYKVRKPGNKKVMRGEITAFTDKEVRDSLVRMGYQIVGVRRNFFSLKPGVSLKEVVVFIRLCADLLREQFPYDEILSMLANDMENARLREAVLEIHKDLKMGKEGKQVFLKHADVFGKFTVHMLGIASTSGNMADIYENTAKFLERSAEFKKNIRSTLFMPAIVFFAALGAAVFYVMYIFPKVAGLLFSYKIKVPPITAATMAVSDYLQHNYLWLLLALLTPIIGLLAYFRSESGRVVWHRMIISIPVVGNLIYKTSIEVFARVFHALYSGSGENIEVIKIASEACRNTYIEKKIKDTVIPAMLREGKGLSDSMEASGIFPKNVIYTLRSGEESGTLREAMLRLANFYEKETTHKMARVIDLINLIVSVFVSMMIVGITLLSSEVGFVSPPTPGDENAAVEVAKSKEQKAKSKRQRFFAMRSALCIILTSYTSASRAMEPMSVRIGQILVQKRIINPIIFEKALLAQKQESAGKQRRLQQILVEDFQIDRHQVYSAIAQLYAFKEIDLAGEKLDDSHLDFIRKTLDACTEEARAKLLNKRVLPYRAGANNKSVLTVIAADPLDREIPVLLKDLPFTQIEIAYCQFEQVAALVDRVMAFKNEFLQQLEASSQNGEVLGAEEEDKIDEAALDAEINRSMLTNLVEGMLVEAVRKGASDVHLIPKEGNVTELHFRIDGKLQLWHALSTAKPESVAAVIKDRSINIDRFNRNIAQDGYIQRKIDSYHIRFRVSVLPIVVSESSRKYESIVIRVLDDRKVITDLNLLGLQEQASRDFEAAIRRPQGVIIVTGPTGSGKSTTLVAALNRIMDPTRNVVTVEEPVEYLIRGARQVKLGPKLNFDQALRSILRHDPDIVMVGEMRDLKSAEIAVSLANTGHITFSTLHTNDAPSAVSRLYMLGVEPFLIANAINLIMAQRLVRKLCESCKQPIKNIDRDMARFVGFPEHEIRNTVFYQPAGCDKCFAGYRGRQCITEALLFTQDIRQIILKNAQNIDEDMIRQEALRYGMLTLRASGRERIKTGTTTIEEVIAATVE